MREPLKVPSWPIFAALVAAIVLVPLGLYVGSYFLTSEFQADTGFGSLGQAQAGRMFSYQWQATIYSPLVRVESAIRGGEIEVYSTDPE